MAFRMVEMEQQYVIQEFNKSNQKDNFDQYLLDKVASLLQEFCRNVAGA